MEEGSNSGEKNYHGTPLSDGEAESALAELPDFQEAVKNYESVQKQHKKEYESITAVQTDIPLTFSPKKYERSIMEEKGAARKEFGAVHIKSLMAADERIVVLHADLAGSGGFDKAEKSFPDRVINVGVAEANMYMMASGMRQTGLLPVTYTFAAFGTNEARANARLIDVNCGHTRCGILNVCTHSGVSVGEDGETHQEQNYLDLPFRHTQVWMPADSNQAGAMAEKSLEIVAKGQESVYVFMPRSGHEQVKTPDGDLLYGKEYVFDGKIDLVRGNGDMSDQVTVLASGITLHAAVQAADALRQGIGNDQIQARVLNVASVRPIDAATIIQAALETAHLIVVEDHNVEGGIATQVADILADFDIPCSLRRLGLNQYYPSASYQDLFLIAGIDSDSVIDAIQDEARVEVSGGEDAFITCIHELQHNLQYSRFEAMVKPFVQKLTQEKGYLESLRETWIKRECPREKMPSNDELRKKLENIL